MPHYEKTIAHETTNGVTLYRMELDGQPVGWAHTYFAAETTLDTLVFELAQLAPAPEPTLEERIATLSRAYLAARARGSALDMALYKRLGAELIAERDALRQAA